MKSESESTNLSGTPSPEPVVTDDSSEEAAPSEATPAAECGSTVGHVSDPDPDAIFLSETYRHSVTRKIRELVHTLDELDGAQLRITGGMKLALRDAAAKETARYICKCTEHEMKGDLK